MAKKFRDMTFTGLQVEMIKFHSFGIKLDIGI